MTVPPHLKPMPVRRTTYPHAGPDVLESAADLLCQARRPLVLVGNGVIRRQAAGQGAADALADLVQRLNLPVIHTFMGKGCIDYHDPHSLGAVGLQRPGADLIAMPQLAEADLVVTVGYDLVEWSPALWNPHRDKEIVHIDSTPAEIDGYYLPALEVVGEIGDALQALARLCGVRKHSWWEPSTQEERNEEAPMGGLRDYASDDSIPMKPQRVIWEMRQALSDDDILVSDVGAHKVWLALHYPTSKPNTVVISNGFATMGIAVPGGLAAKLALPDSKVVAVSGDGGFLMNSQELETARRLGVAYVNVVWTDGRYGVIELNQQRRFGRTFGVEFTNPDLVQYANSFGLPAWRVEQADDFRSMLRRALDMDVPTLIEVPVDHTENMRLGSPPGK
jgi:acetolactate synthase-1/2/3 large subunit